MRSLYLEIYRKLRPGEPPTVDSRRKSLIKALFFDPRRYDLSAVGRYKFNKKMALWTRLVGPQFGRMPVADPGTGEIVAEAGVTSDPGAVHESRQRLRCE